jgi:hypothetical protein
MASPVLMHNAPLIGAQHPHRADGYLAGSSEGEMMEWQPIETAPKDGREVWLYLGAPWCKTEKAKWYAPWENWQVGEIPSDPAREDCCGIGSAVPTHWMPMPAPPLPDNAM